MTSYLVEGVLLIALVVTSARVAAMYRELKRLRAHHEAYERVFEETRRALGGLERAIEDMNGRSGETLAALGERIDEGRAVVEALDGRLRTAAALGAGRGADAAESSWAAAPVSGSA
ncbi:hypothetical protein ACUN0C_09275 [Faunimonas sp. B44]|uniref:hypothetical protein n=1 Tax=Faunimonas sp. B44 TaxID=3461493 RepID=UPI00404488DC